MKKIKTILSLTMALCISAPVGAFASDTIPAHMKPGTIIQYDENKEMNIIKQGDIEVDNEMVEKFGNVNESLLPEVKPNMTVSYDALGTPIVKGDLSSETKNPDNNNLSCKGSEQGYVSWFDIWAESNTASGKKASDGAAHKKLKLFTNVRVCNEEKNYVGTDVRILDRGPYVDGRILDMSKESFKQVENLNRGVFYGALYY